MKNFKQVFILLVLLLPALFFSQGNKDFQKRLDEVNKDCNAAYQSKDEKAYEKSLKGLQVKYDELDAANKKGFKSRMGGLYYNLACVYSLQNNKPAALDNLDKAIRYNYLDYAHMQEDSDLDNIRKESRFSLLTEPLKQYGDYLFILKKAGAYNYEEKQVLPAFTYQAANNENLLALKKYFNLDSIAGAGNETSKILNLLHWIHRLIPHDGTHENPAVKNAMSMMAECKKGNRGLNCRGLATVLNECYLAQGFKSRIITCLPKDSLGIDNDCHVINMVYNATLNKWLWIDPTFDAYVMDEKGQLLSIEEVRERIISDRPLILNPEANWNGKVSQTKEYYLLNYMAKNLYRLECPLSSEYDYETKTENKITAYLELRPLEYFKKSLEKGTSTNNVTKTITVMYRTNNPAVFWQKPEAEKK